MSFTAVTEKILQESTEQLRENLNSALAIASSTVSDQYLWSLLMEDDEVNPNSEKLKKTIKRIGFGFSKALDDVKRMAT